MNIKETCELILNWADKLQREKLTKAPYYYSGGSKVGKQASRESREPQEQGDEKIQAQSHSAQSEPQQPQHAQPIRESHYCDVLKIKKEKNGNITPDNIGEIMLCTIPGISSKTAIVIMKEYKTMNGLIKSLENDAHCLNNIYMETNANGKKRKISSQCIENIRSYLLGNV
jgi:5'-3' exonuclease